MEKFRIEKKIGDGTYGSVLKAVNTQTGEEVAIKQMKKKFSSWDECINLREIKCLRKLNHPNLIKLKEVVKLHDELNLVFENLDQNIYQFYMGFRDRQQHIPEHQIKSIIYQIVNGLAYMHKHGFFHRDLKPENILHQNGIVKIIDFGLAREIRSRPPYTDYVSTRWYRAPELLLRSTVYNSPVDIFAVGCIMAELYNLAPIFSGSNELDQLNKVMKVLGTPTPQQWQEGHKLATKIGITFSQYEKQPLEKVIPKASKEAIDLLSWMFTYESTKRPTAQQILSHSYFAGVIDPSASQVPPSSSGGIQETNMIAATSPNKGLKNFQSGEHFPELRASNAFQKPKNNNPPINHNHNILGNANNNNANDLYQFGIGGGPGYNAAPSNKPLLPPKNTYNLPQQSYIPSSYDNLNAKPVKLPFLDKKPPLMPQQQQQQQQPQYEFSKPSYLSNNNNTYNFSSNQNYQPYGIGNSYQPNSIGSYSVIGNSYNNMGGPSNYKPPLRDNNANNLGFAARNNILNNYGSINQPNQGYNHESTSMPPLGKRNNQGSFGGGGGLDKQSYNKYAF